MSDELKLRLQKSSAVKSLTDERRVYDIFRRLNWSPVHGGFYIDCETGKAREFDVIARRLWSQTLSKRKKYARLRIVTEVKSAEGYHLVFSSRCSNVDFQPKNRIWLGCEGTERDRICKCISEEITDTKIRNSILTRFSRCAFPRQLASIWRLSVDPFPIERTVSAFRETNTDKSKELESSVLWRASLGLQSLITSLTEKAFTDAFESFKGEWQFLCEENKNNANNLDWIQETTDYLELIHPILITDSSLWLSNDSSLEQIPWCRFVQINDYGHPIWWMDVVRQDSFESFAALLTKYYLKSFKKAGAKIER